MFTKQTIRDIDVKHKTVLLHAELDAPLTADGTAVTSTYRLLSSRQTIAALLAQDCKIILASKLGRPDGKVNLRMSLAPVARALAEILKQPITFVPDCVGPEVRKAAAALKPGQIMLLENVRFHAEEEANDEAFAAQMAADTGAELFVQDCFALAHRKEVLTDAITRMLPSVAGLHLEKEVDIITKVMSSPKRPLMAIVGGAKIADKIDVLHRFIEIADIVAIGGAMANTFLKADSIDVGDSLYDSDELSVAKDVMRQARAAAKVRRFVFYIPQDGVVASRLDRSAPTRIVDWSTHVVAEIENYPKRPPAASGQIHAHEKLLDIGPFSGAFIAGSMQLAETVVWNGTMGVTEVSGLQGPVGPFAHGTDLVMDAMLGQFARGQQRPFSLVGGGDTVGYLESRGLTDAFDHVSTGGGASLELMAGRKLSGVEALRDKLNPSGKPL